MPAKRAQLGGVERIAAIVTLPVLHRCDERRGLLKEFQDLVGQIDIFHLVAAADVVHLTVRAALDHAVERAAVIEHVQPVAHVAAVAVEWHRNVVEKIGDEERNNFLRELIRAVIVRTPA